MTQFFWSALWALCWFISLLHFKIFKFNSKESPLCHTFWSAKYKLTCQRWHFQTRQYIHPFSTQNFLAFGVTFFAPKFDTNLATIPWTNKKIYFRILKHAAQHKGIYSLNSIMQTPEYGVKPIQCYVHLNRFHTLFWPFHCWFWTGKCRLGNSEMF